ncbi:MAG TPA: hypothetical protein PLS50_01630 [Candidatus Dojkabacteria bacterium]|nr:hypothetical protein [Candidatus Dojkabacteria bacterium]
MNIIARQTVQVTVNFSTLNDLLHPSIASLPLNLRFQADMLHVKSIAYGSTTSDVEQVIQVDAILQTIV